jgi:hypothetical protein
VKQASKDKNYPPLTMDGGRRNGVFFFFAEVGKILFAENLVGEEKRKTAYWRMQGDPETGDPQEWSIDRLPPVLSA